MGQVEAEYAAEYSPGGHLGKGHSKLTADCGLQPWPGLGRLWPSTLLAQDRGGQARMAGSGSVC